MLLNETENDRFWTMNSTCPSWRSGGRQNHRSILSETRNGSRYQSGRLCHQGNGGFDIKVSRLQIRSSPEARGDHSSASKSESLRQTWIRVMAPSRINSARDTPSWSIRQISRLVAFLVVAAFAHLASNARWAGAMKAAVSEFDVCMPLIGSIA